MLLPKPVQTFLFTCACLQGFLSFTACTKTPAPPSPSEGTPPPPQPHGEVPQKQIINGPPTPPVGYEQERQPVVLPVPNNNTPPQK